MKIALIQCPGWGRDCPPYTMALLSAILRNAAHEVFCFDLNIALYYSSPEEYRKFWDDKDLYSFWSSEDLVDKFIHDNQRMLDFQIEQILNTEAKIIGFTVHFSSLITSLYMARRVKQIDKKRIIVFGGPDCSRQLRGLDLIKEDAVDVVNTGEGDLSILELAKQIESRGKVDYLKGYLVKKNGSFVDCGDIDVVANLDELPFPDYSDFREDILAGLYRQPERLEILDSRGCPTRCHFCSEWQFWKRFRSMSGERIFTEISYQIKKYRRVDYFYFIGSLLNGNIKALSDFCDLVIKNGLRIRWLGQPIVRREMTRGFLHKMRKAGCEWLGYGIESGSQRIINKINKKFSIKLAEQVLRDTHDVGIQVQANFMFGIPTETEEDFKDTLSFLKRNRDSMDSVLASQSFCVIDKDTYLYNHPEEFGISDRGHHLYWEASEKNTYPERFRRYEEFCNLALSLGLPETSGVLRAKPDKYRLLGDYYLYKKDYPAAIDCFQKAIKTESQEDSIMDKITQCRQELEKKDSRYIEIRDLGFSQRELCKNYSYNFDPKTDKIIHVLKRLGLKQKAENFILIEKQKLNREEYILGYPYWLTIDPTNYCNLKCPFCPTGQGRNSRSKAILSLDNFRRVIDELGSYLIHIDFCNWGEPFLNDEICEMVKLAKQYDIDTKVDSNLNILREKDMEGMIMSGLDKLIVSIDGITQQTYSKYRIGGDLNRAMSNLKTLIKKKNLLRRDNPYVTWQFLVFRHNEHEIERVKKIGEDIGVNEVCATKAFIGNKDWIPKNKEYTNYDIEKIKNAEQKTCRTSTYLKSPQGNRCNWPWEAVVINPNGSVSPCCSVEDERDDFGNIFQNGFKNIWNNARYIQARRYIKNKAPDENFQKNICFNCPQSGLINLDLLSCKNISDEYNKENKEKAISSYVPIIEKDTKAALVLTPGWGRGSPPYMLALLTAILRQKNYRVYPFDISNSLYHFSKEKDKLLWNWEESFFWQKKDSVDRYVKENSGLIDQMVDRILSCGVKIVGFSVYSTTKLMSLELARRIKTKSPDVNIVFGGAECQRRLDWSALVLQDYVDFLIFDEADESFPELIELLAKEDDLSSCKGIAYKKGDKIVDTGYRHPLKDLDSLPFADFSDFDFLSYKNQDPHVLQIATSRGCPEQCVYCSTKASVERFRTMSGERIFQEIRHQIKLYKRRFGRDREVYLFFLDLLINANIKVLEEWTSKLAEEMKKDSDLAYLHWYGQIILRKDMTRELLYQLKQSGCNLLNYGIESGSSKVLKDMKKRLNANEMENIVRLIYEAGISGRGNFMFGFPTETEEDFEETMEFLRKNGAYMKEIYPSRTFCALERFSYLDSHKDEFGVLTPHPGGENLFWESQESNNNYLVRLKRYERFCELAASFDHNPLLTGVEDIKRDNWLCLGEYYRFTKRYEKAVDCYRQYLSSGGTDRSVHEHIKFCEQKSNGSSRLENSFQSNKGKELTLRASIREQNISLNGKETEERKIILESTPPHVYFQIDGHCNQNCIFCSRPDNYRYFSLDEYKENLEGKLYPIFSNADTIYFTGAGEFLLLPEAEEILRYFDREFPYTGKMFATNGSTLAPKIAHLISESKSKYRVHVSLHASNAQLHKKLTCSDNFEKVIENIRYLCELRNKLGNPEVHLMFVATTVNIEDLPDFVKLSASLKVDRVYCEYNSIYRPEQKHLSCYFKKDLTNSIFDRAEKIANALNVNLDLPWRFNQETYPEIMCNTPWTQIMINLKGEVLPCCLFGDFHESLLEKDFWQIWNGEVYQRIRKCLLNEAQGYCETCLRSRPYTVNDFRSHIIWRGISENKSDSQTEEIISRT